MPSATGKPTASSFTGGAAQATGRWEVALVAAGAGAAVAAFAL